MPSCFLAAVFTVAVGVAAPQSQSPSSELPAIDLTVFPPVVQQQVQEAYQAARANPRDAEASGRVGMLLDLYKRREQAQAWYERAHELDPEAFRWLYYLGSLQSALGKRAEATSTLRAALGLRPDYLPAQLKYAESLLATGAWEEAAGIYASVAAQHPEAAEAYYGIGRIRAANGDLAGAKEAYQRACELFPAYGAAHYGLAQVYRKLGDSASAEDHLKVHRANRTLVPPVPDPLNDEMRELDRGAASIVQRGIRFEQAGRIEDAIAEHEKALELDPELVLAHANLIILYGKTKQMQKAEEHFHAAIRLNPNSAESYYNYGVLLFDQRRFPEAEGMFLKAVEVNPFYSQAFHNLGFLKEQQGQWDQALEFYRKAVERQPNYPLAHFHIGRILANQKKYDEAISQFLMALTPEDGSTPAYLYALSATYARAGNLEEALKYGRQARDKAEALGQTELLRTIEKDLQTLEAARNR